MNDKIYLANDVPERCVPGWGKISLPEYLDYNRTGNGWEADVVAWHITPTHNLESIKANGLHPTSCAKHTSSMSDRPSAVYLFCARSVIKNNAKALISVSADYTVVKVTIPASELDKLYPDNLYNFSVECSGLSAIQYRDNIPAEWITIE